MVSEKPSQGNLWLLIRKVSWQRRLPTFSERTSNLSRKIEFTAVKSFVWRCQFIDFVPHEVFISVPCSMRLFMGSKSHHRRTAARCNSPWLVLSSQGPVICRSRSRFEHINHNMMHVMGKEIWGICYNIHDMLLRFFSVVTCNVSSCVKFASKRQTKKTISILNQDVAMYNPCMFLLFFDVFCTSIS